MTDLSIEADIEIIFDVDECGENCPVCDGKRMTKVEALGRILGWLFPDGHVEVSGRTAPRWENDEGTQDRLDKLLKMAGMVAP